ncbi:hypothetical protein R3P38DRAFT_3225974 [Favolaschia claudopus]|uniref:Uncharacterized protein n=1 Tax=Favolaschia claudopus TaxID=2862362 RepID=A0AAV9ZU36_9AGAR
MAGEPWQGLAYFQGLKKESESQGFKKDERLREGLQEIVESKTFRIRIVTKTTGNKTNEKVIVDGVVYLQVGGILASDPGCRTNPLTMIDRWWYNASDMGTGLVNLL